MTFQSEEVVAFRGSIVHCLKDPGWDDRSDGLEVFSDGLLVIRDGRVSALGPARELLHSLVEGTRLTDYSGHLIAPGFIDCHVHYPQIDMIASYGAQLLDWLERYTFPTERKFCDYEHAKACADFFLDELLKNGTTTAMVFATVHPESVEAIFNSARDRRMRLYSGKVLMDRNCPSYLRQDPDTSYRQSSALIERWDGADRLGYAITPRFAPTSSPELLAQARRLQLEHPDAYLHTHLAETQAEVRWVANLFPDARSYLDVYCRAGFVRNRCILAHGIHVNDQDLRQISQSGAAIAFCPSSNLFLGSGLFDARRAARANVRLGLGTDVGAGTSLGMLQTMGDGYKVHQLQGSTLSPAQALYLATLGGARALHVEDRIGNFEIGKEADFTVIDRRSTPLIKHRTEHARDIADEIFIQMTLGDDRAVAATYLLGRIAHERTDRKSKSVTELNH